MSYELIALLMFASMLLLLATGQRVFGAIGFVATAFALALWGEGGFEMPFNASFVLLNWYPLVTLPMFIYMGYMLAESGIADDLYRMFHVWAGPVRGGLAIGTILLMVVIAAMNGLSVAGMAIGATIALPELLRRGYDKVMVTGVVQAGSTLGILVPPSVVLILYGMIARQPIGQLWMAGVFPGLLLAGLFIAYIALRCWIQPDLGPPLPLKERQQISWGEKFRLLGAGIVPLLIFFFMTGPLPDGRDQPHRELRRGRGRRDHYVAPQGPADQAGHGEHAPPDAERELHVHVDPPRRDVLRCRVRRPRRRARDPVSFPGRVGTGPLGSHHPDAAQLI